MSEELKNAPEMEAENQEQTVVETDTIVETIVEETPEVVETIEIPVVEEVIVEEIPVVEEVIEEEIPVVEEVITEEIPIVEEVIVEEIPVVEEVIVEEIPVMEEVTIEEIPIEEVKMEVVSTDELPEIETVPAEKKFIPKHIENAYSNLDEFNWDNLEKKGSKYSETDKSRYVELYTKSFKSIDENEVIEGTVVSFNTREIVVNIGFKSDGVISASELRYNNNLKIGDIIEVYVENQEDATGQLQLSHKKARLLQSWNRVNKAHDDGEIITGYVKCRTKGGLIVDVFGIEAFLPGSQIDVKPIRDYDIYVNKTMEFKVVKINHEYKNVVVSHKALIEDELEAQKAEIIARLEKGQILEGTVKNITSYGVFIDLGGVDGLIHITDLSWGRISHPEEIVTLDSKINVVILDFDENKKRIALGLKQLTPHPWDALSAELKEGDRINGKVVVIADYGAFIEVNAGVEGLVHVSEMSWSQHLRTAHDFLKVGQEVETVILTLNRDERKMSLGIKQLIPDPWGNITTKYPLGSRHSATVRNFTNFGIFVELEEGIDGLIHISDLSWSKKIKHPAEFTKIGEKIDVVVLEADIENHRLSLGHKQLEENPWDAFENVFAVGTTHQGTIVGHNDKGLIIALPYGIEGFCFNRASQKEDKSNPKVEETLAFRVLEFDKNAKKINLSHSRTWQESREDEEKRVVSEDKKQKKDIDKINENTEKSTLGDLNVLQSLKEDLEKTNE